MLLLWRRCPLRGGARHVQMSGTIGHVGCGHGLFARLLARQSPDRNVLGIDLDAHKIALAQQLQVPNLQFIAGDVAETTLPPADAISIVDVFYLVPYAVQEHLLSVCADKLAPGGAIILKEMSERPRWKTLLNWLEETLAVRVLRITASADAGKFYFRSREEWRDLFAKLGFTVETIPLDRGYYHPHVLFIARKQSA